MVGAAWQYQDDTLKAAQGRRCRRRPEGGRHRLGRHVDGVVQGAAPELHVHVDELHQHPVGAGPAGAQYFGETPANPLACPIMDKMPGGSCDAVPRERTDQRLQRDQVLEDADRDCDNGKNDCVPYARVVTAWNDADHDGPVEPPVADR